MWAENSVHLGLEATLQNTYHTGAGRSGAVNTRGKSISDILFYKSNSDPFQKLKPNMHYLPNADWLIISPTVVFNKFVFAQIFNLVNSRRIDRKLNIFKCILNNWYFMVITIIGELILSPFELPS